MNGRLGGEREDSRVRAIPEATVARLAVYLRVLSELGDRGLHAGGASTLTTISSKALAQAAGVNSAKLRKDLSFLGSYGIRGVGYDVRTLTEQISNTLGAHRAHRVALVGMGNLGQALAGYAGFGGRGFVISALFDVDPQRIGRELSGVRIDDIRDADRVCRQGGVTIGVIATPAGAAQEAARVLVDAGVRSILNFAPSVLTVPEDVEVRHVDLALELQVLAFHEARRADGLDGRTLRSAGAPGDGRTLSADPVTGGRAPAGLLAAPTAVPSWI